MRYDYQITQIHILELLFDWMIRVTKMDHGHQMIFGRMRPAGHYIATENFWNTCNTYQK